MSFPALNVLLCLAADFLLTDPRPVCRSCEEESFLQYDGAVDDFEQIWFSVEFELGEARSRPDDVWTLREVAELTGRSLSAVKVARQQGRIPAATPPPGLRGYEAQAAFVEASREDLAAWRVKSVEEVLSSRPDLPDDPERWLRINELAEALDLTRSGVKRRIESMEPRRLEWGREGPFQTEIRYWVPDLEREDP